MNTNNQDILNLVEILAQLGLAHVVLSPGSRNAPLIKAFNQHPSITCYSVVDERSAGFFGLGMAQQLQLPVAVVCTSGSAVLNYGPAVVEAYYQRVPLLVISADRPMEWIGQGDGQAINQRQVFQNFSKGFFEFKESRGQENSLWHNERSAAEAYNLTKLHPFGPVHLNVPLNEPLYGVTSSCASLLSKPTQTIQSQLTAPIAAVKQLANSISESRKVMVLVGQLHPNKDINDAVHLLSKLPQVSVLTETTANLFGNGYIDQIDNTLATIGEEEGGEFAPNLLISFGGMVVTKRLKQFLRKNFPSQHWHIDSGYNHIDTYQHLSHHLQALPIEVLKELNPLVNSNASATFGHTWQEKKKVAISRHNTFLETTKYSDLLVFRELLKQLPSGCQLQIGNSTPIRYVQLFENNPSISHFCNRGVSGIDGCTSTATGAAVGSGKPTVLISGEVSFIYDNNGLWNNATPSNFVAIVINNGGGNIFRIIDGPEQFEEMPAFIETVHQVKVKELAELHGFRYLTASNLDGVKKALPVTLDFTSKTILEIFTPRELSPQVLKDYWRFLKEGI